MLAETLGVAAAAGSVMFLLSMFRSMAKSKKAIAESGHPEYMRHSFRGGYVVMLCVAIPLAIAAVLGFSGGDVATIIFAMSSPVIFLLGFMQVDRRWKTKHPELVPTAMKGIEARIEQLAAWQKTGQLSQSEYLKRTREIQQEIAKTDTLGR